MLTQYQTQYFAHALTLQGSGGSVDTLSRSISNSRVDLNPHQIDAALFAFRSPLSKGVINFLNRRNEADQRVFQLLSEKFRLFDGVFGASDEVLGAIESGVDIERRIARVYQECRTPEEITAARLPLFFSSVGPWCDLLRGQFKKRSR